VKTLAVIFCYRRPVILWHCANTLFQHTETLPDEVLFIDDGSGAETAGVLANIVRRFGDRTNIAVLAKPKNCGFSHSLQFAFQRARAKRPDYLWLIEADYIFASHGLDAVADVMENTPEGRECFGICGYDHPDFHRRDHREGAYPEEMREMVGEDNVNRAVLWQPVRLAGKRKGYEGCLASNTCISSYLNWRHLGKVAAEHPEIEDYLDLAAAPINIPGHPLSGQLAAARCPDDGMLSAGLNLVWNQWALAHGIDRGRFAAWLNIRPSVANHISGGGLHTAAGELETDAASPSWTGRV
jgi:glycosyltransferase involved in cell wall biosynthesis